MPHPEVGTIFLVRENLTPPPSMLESAFMDYDILLSWDEPALGNGNSANPDSYNIYYQMGSGEFELLQNVFTNSYTHYTVTMAGMHTYFVTAVYNSEESDPSNQVEVELTTPAPAGLNGQLLADNVALFWDVPTSNGDPMAALIEYNIYHKLDDGDFELLMSVETTGYAHENINPGVHSYYVTAVYDGAESEPSDEIQIELIISGVSDELSGSINIYPNPVVGELNVKAENELKGFTLFNQTGQILMQQEVNGKNFKVNLNDVPNGIYIMQLDTHKRFNGFKLSMIRILELNTKKPAKIWPVLYSDNSKYY
jgi:hypothetical protein